MLTDEQRSAAITVCDRAPDVARQLLDMLGITAAEQPEEGVKWPCHGCGRPMRTIKTPVHLQPGTVPHNGRGLCMTCYGHDRQEATDA